MPAANPAWRKRPSNRQWDDHDDARLIQVMADGLIIECVPPLFEGHDFGDILRRRLDLIRAGRLTIAEPL